MQIRNLTGRAVTIVDLNDNIIAVYAADRIVTAVEFEYDLCEPIDGASVRFERPVVTPLPAERPAVLLLVNRDAWLCARSWRHDLLTLDTQAHVMKDPVGNVIAYGGFLR